MENTDLAAYLAEIDDMLTTAITEEGVDEATARTMVRPRLQEILSTVEETTEEIGTIWISGEKPKTKVAKLAIAHINNNIEDKRLDGVTDEDIVQWWNLSALQRRVFIALWDMHRLGIMVFIAQNFEDAFEASSADEYMDLVGDYAAARSRGVTPFFTYEQNPGNAGNPSRGLPMELTFRILEWISQFESPGYDVHNDEIENLNALIRREIAAGNI